MAFTHTIGKATDPWHVPAHKHDTMVEARECELEAAYNYEGHLQAQAEMEAEVRYERWLEDGGAAGERIAWENEQDRLLEEALR